MALALLLSGTTLPLTMLPERVQTLAELTPLHPVAELLTIGLTGLGPDGVAVGFGETFALAAQPLAVLAAWCVLGRSTEMPT